MQFHFKTQIMFDKNKIKSLGGLKDKAAADITPEEIQAVNTELAGLGFAGVEMTVSGALAAAVQAAADAKVTLNANAATIADLNTKLEAAEKVVPEANTTLVTAKDKIAAPGDEQPEDEGDGGAAKVSTAILEKAGLI